MHVCIDFAGAHARTRAHVWSASTLADNMNIIITYICLQLEGLTGKVEVLKPSWEDLVSSICSKGGAKGGHYGLGIHFAKSWRLTWVLEDHKGVYLLRGQVLPDQI